jgi:riboflavin kinase / FMN adenylyltransferase
MKIYRSLQEIRDNLGPTIVTVGNFDGVHLGHQHVLKQVVERARASGCQAMVVTFDPHPLRILRPDVAPRLITPRDTKEALLAKSGVDALLSIPFTRDFSMTAPAEFARNILMARLRAREVHEGENFHFGHKAEGNAQRLQDFGREFGFAVTTYPVMMIRGEPVSSSTFAL